MRTTGQDGVSTVGGGIHIVGEIKGEEDLVIAGRVTGAVFLPNTRVRIEAGGDVLANITARLIEVEGKLVGDLKAGERVVIGSSGVVDGGIVSPQVRIIEGCEFKGSVQMRAPDLDRVPPLKQPLTDSPPQTGSGPGEE